MSSLVLSLDEMGEVNWRPSVDAFCRCIDAWRSRALSFSGRAVVLNSLALSRIWYVASVVAMPKSVLKELNTRIFFSGQVKRPVSPERYFTALNHKAVFP